MTSIPLVRSGGVAGPVLISVALAGVVWLRWAATVSARMDALAVGLAFGLGLLVLAVAGGARARAPQASAVALGLAGGSVLVGLALATRHGPALSLAPAAPFVPWAAVTVLVACTEEAVLRGVLLDELDRRLGRAAAVLLTSLLFALIHVPLYGWHVVPLDLGVGLWLAGLRLASRGIVAPAIAHAVADLATWWL